MCVWVQLGGGGDAGMCLLRRVVEEDIYKGMCMWVQLGGGGGAGMCVEVSG